MIEKPEYDIEVLFKCLKSIESSHDFQIIEKFTIGNSLCVELINEADKMSTAVAELNKLAIDMHCSIKRNIWIQFTRENDLYIYLYAEKEN